MIQRTSSRPAIAFGVLFLVGCAPGLFRTGAPRSSEDTALSKYGAIVRATVLKSWQRIETPKVELVAVARFEIAATGELLKEEIVQSSGDTSFDEGVLSSVRSAAPFPPFPKQLPRLSQKFRVTFKNKVP